MAAKQRQKTQKEKLKDKRGWNPLKRITNL
jgi:hypothetical protein